MDRPVTIALVVAAVLALQPGLPGSEGLGVLGAIGVVLLLSSRWHVAPIAIAVLLIIGVALRAAVQIHAGSDGLDVTGAAIQRALAGGNPYGVGYDVSRPPGAPFPYGPLALLWYAPVQVGGWQLELVMSCVVLTLLAVRGRLLGLAIYALGPTLVATASDGSNDTSVGLVLLLAFVVAARRPVLGAVLLAVAVALKPYAAAWLPAFLLWAGWGSAAAFAATTLVLWSPVLLVWGIGSFVSSLQQAGSVHLRPYWSLAQLVEDVTHLKASRPVFDAFRLVLGGLTAIATLRWARTLDGVILAGALVYLVTLFAGYWGTYAYFGAIAPILCWRIDDWLGLESRPLVEPQGSWQAA
ncbi:MAG TPA: hypothetical protein VET90_09190 [Candidatus Binatus sp.]|nr:hypothetical protein [Candidatus Binatus sp.]